jgi:hypothetical protein
VVRTNAAKWLPRDSPILAVAGGPQEANLTEALLAGHANEIMDIALFLSGIGAMVIVG